MDRVCLGMDKITLFKDGESILQSGTDKLVGLDDNSKLESSVIEFITVTMNFDMEQVTNSTID